MKKLGRTLLVFFLTLAAPAFAQSTVTYTYDALGRLVRSVSSGTSTANTSYTLDPAGNRTNVTVTGASTLPSFSINSAFVAAAPAVAERARSSAILSGSLR